MKSRVGFNKLTLDRVRVERRAIGSGAIVLQLPFPPTSEEKRSRSEEYGEWLDQVGLQIEGRRLGCAVGPVEVTITLEDRPRGYDPDDRVKAVLAVLTKHGFIDDDNHKVVRKLTTQVGNVTGAHVEIIRSAA